MDINSLLSPQDSAVEAPPPQQSPLPSPSKRPLRQPPRRTSSLSQQIASSPQLQDQLPAPTLSHNAYHTHLAMGSAIPSPGVASVPSGRAMHNPTGTPPLDPRNSLGSMQESRMTPPHSSLHRQTSTPGMDALAGRYS